jgi:hypothetical protein
MSTFAHQHPGIGPQANDPWHASQVTCLPRKKKRISFPSAIGLAVFPKEKSPW